MKKPAFFVFFFIVSSLFAEETVRIGTFSLPPFMMEIGQEKRTGGAAIDYWEKYIAPKMGVKIQAVGPFPALRIMKMLEDGEVDAIPNMTKVPSREAAFIFPTTPLTEIESCLVVLKDSKLTTVTKQEDLYGLNICYLESAFIPPLLQNNKITFELVANLDYARTFFEKLEAGRNDAFLHINKVSLLYELKAAGFMDKVRVIPLPTEKIKVYCIFQKSERGERLAGAFDKINAQYLPKGVYDALAKKYTD